MAKPHVVFVVGEDEYRSEHTLSGFAAGLEELGRIRSTVLTPFPDPRDATNIPGLEALDKADLAVFYLRWRELPDEQMRRILRFLERNRPIMGFRTSTHAFRYPPEAPYHRWNDGFGEELFGTPWRFHYGHTSSTDVSVIEEAAAHPILRGVPSYFHTRSWLYQVLPLPEDCQPLLMGKSVGAGRDPEEDRPPNPVAWTRIRNGARLFYTSLGHWDDFQQPEFHRVVENAIFWCLDQPSSELLL